MSDQSSFMQWMDEAPDPWTCEDCGHVNSPDSPVCRCYFWDDEPTREPDNWEERHREEEESFVHCDMCGKICTADTAITDDFFNYCDNVCYERAQAQEGA